MTRGVRFVASVIVGVFSLFVLMGRARAADPDIQVSVDTQKLGVGDTLRLTMHVTSSQHPEQPQLTRNQGLSVVGSSSGPSQSVSIINGQVTTKQGLDANWTLRADRVGNWPVGPVTIQIGKSRYRADPITVTVVAAGQAPRRAAPDPFDPFGSTNPFDPFKNFFDQLNPAPERPEAYGVDPKLGLDESRGALAFLHATLEPTNAVVGQQVTVTMYLYTDPTEREVNMADVHEATAADFLKKPLFEDDNSNRNVSHAMVGGHVFTVHMLRKWALFPLKAGDLVVTPMELTLVRSRGVGEPTRQSETFTVHVTEPPMDKRPPGYTLGDVGDFALAVDVTPRDVEQDSAIGVNLTLSGTGNLPAMITPPAQAGVEWLPPEIHEKVGAQKGDTFGGTRTFSYVVRLHKAGDVGLGAVGLPYWNPNGRQYHVARAELGTVTVRPNPAHDKAEAPVDPLPGLPAIRESWGGTRAPTSHLAESHPGWFWFLLGVGPFGFLFFSGVSSTIKSVTTRAAERATSPLTELATRISKGNQAAAGSDAREIVASTMRSLEAATMAYADTTVRDARGGEAKERLVQAGVAKDVSDALDALLSECETIRFAPEEPSLADARVRWSKAKDIIIALKATRRAG